MNIILTLDELAKNIPFPDALRDAQITVLSMEGKGKKQVGFDAFVDLMSAVQKQNIKIETVKMPATKEALLFYLGFRATGKKPVSYVSSDKTVCKTINDTAKMFGLSDLISAIPSIKHAIVINEVPAAGTGETPAKGKKSQTKQETATSGGAKKGRKKEEEPDYNIPGQMSMGDISLAQPKEKAEKKGERAEKTSPAEKQKKGRKQKATVPQAFEDILTAAKVRDDITAAGQDYKKMYSRILSAVRESEETISFEVQLRVKVLDAKLTRKLYDKLSPVFKELKEAADKE